MKLHNWTGYDISKKFLVWKINDFFLYADEDFVIFQSVI